MIQIYVDDRTEARLKKTAHETGRTVEELASSAVEEDALRAWRGKSGDPADTFFKEPVER